MRSLTEVFVLLRNNAIQSRHIFSDGGRDAGMGSRGEERLSLVPLGESEDVGVGRLGGSASRIPPEWVNMVDEVQYEMSRIRQRLKELREMETKHLNRPSFNDDSSQEEKAIQAAAGELAKMLAHSQRLIGHIKNAGTAGGRAEAALQQNVTSALIAALQSLTVELRGSQGEYVRQLQSREESFAQYFGPESSGTLVSLSPERSGGVDWATRRARRRRRGSEAWRSCRCWRRVVRRCGNESVRSWRCRAASRS